MQWLGVSAALVLLLVAGPGAPQPTRPTVRQDPEAILLRNERLTMGLARSLSAAGRTEEAIDRLEALVHSGPTNPEVYRLLGHAHAEAGNQAASQLAVGNYYFALGITPMFLISGIFFPLEGLPEAVQTAAWISPLTHVVRVVRALVLGVPEWAHLLDVLWLGTLSLLLINVALWRMRKRLIV